MTKRKLSEPDMDGPEVDFFKVFNDPIHGLIEMPPLCVKIIDTQQFQRLRYIKQLGCAYQVFPGAAHNRFEHSLGVCHLAGMLCSTLQKRQPELKITEKDVLCVQIAGLCHDLGHGPFSHVFDNNFIPAVIPNSKWKHEKASVAMFEYLIEANELKDGLDDQDIDFIKEQIAGPLEQTDSSTPWPYSGRSENKRFLYEIVANKRNGIDVDKWDYFLRDCHNLGISSSFDCQRFMKFCRVIEVDGSKQICTRDKEVDNVYEMFHTRHRLHRRAYQHKVTKIIETMIVEALVAANDHCLVEGKDGKMVKMSEAIDDMVAYTNLTDDIILQIMRSDKKELAESKTILQMVQRRQLYKYIGRTSPTHSISDPIRPMERSTLSRVQETNSLISVFNGDKKKTVPDIKEEILKYQDKVSGPKLNSDQLIVHIVKLNYGMGEQNPIDSVRFYSKDNPEQAFFIGKEQVSLMIPEHFEEQFIRVYLKLWDQASVDKARTCFQEWCKVPKAVNVPPPEPRTPSKTNPQKDHQASKKAKCSTQKELFKE